MELKSRVKFVHKDKNESVIIEIFSTFKILIVASIIYLFFLHIFDLVFKLLPHDLMLGGDGFFSLWGIVASYISIQAIDIAKRDIARFINNLNSLNQHIGSESKVETKKVKIRKPRFVCLSLLNLFGAIADLAVMYWCCYGIEGDPGGASVAGGLMLIPILIIFFILNISWIILIIKTYYKYKVWTISPFVLVVPTLWIIAWYVEFTFGSSS